MGRRTLVICLIYRFLSANDSPSMSPREKSYSRAFRVIP